MRSWREKFRACSLILRGHWTSTYVSHDSFGTTTTVTFKGARYGKL